MLQHISDIRQNPPPHNQHFLALDGLRGLAALCISFYHIQQIFGGEVFGHAVLAVDFFFILSGFVLSFAYGDKLLNRLRFVPYMTLRIIRLYPMIVLGVAIAALYTLPVFQNPADASATLIFNLLAIPYPSHGALGFLNAPEWSLFFEMVASVVFGLTVRYLSLAALIAFVVTSGVVFAFGSVYTGQENLGWIVPLFWWGFPRVLFCVFAGVLLHRLQASGRLGVPRMPAWMLGGLLVASFAVPKLSGDFLYEIPTVFLLYPPLVAMGARDDTQAGFMARAMKFGGELSYPLYILHWPVLVLSEKTMVALGWPVHAHARPFGAFGVLAALAFAYVALKLYDEPVRRWLRNRLDRTPRRVADAPGVGFR